MQGIRWPTEHAAMTGLRADSLNHSLKHNHSYMKERVQAHSSDDAKTDQKPKGFHNKGPRAPAISSYHARANSIKALHTANRTQ